MNETKKKKRRGQLSGFDGVKGTNTAKRLRDMKSNPPAGKWRAFKQIRIKHTVIDQKWNYGDEKVHTIKHICPWGMVQFVSKLLVQDRNKHQCKILPESVKEAFSLTDENYDSNSMKVSCSNPGDMGFETFFVLYCNQCPKLPEYTSLLEKNKSLLPSDPQIEHLQEHWDEIIGKDKSAHWYVDFCGCLLPNKEDIVAGPNGRRFILRPCEHFSKLHKAAAATIQQSSSRKRPLEKSEENILTSSQGQVQTVAQCTKIASDAQGKKVKVTSKGKSHANLFTQPTVSEMLDPRISLFEKPKDDDDIWAQDYALSMILSSVNKNVSQNTILETYETAMEGVRTYHTIRFGSLQLNGKKIPIPPRVPLDGRNLPVIQKAILDSYKVLNSSSYKPLRDGAHNDLYSVYNDGIQKFTKEFNGVMVRTLNDDLKTVNIPWALTKIPGGSMDSLKLVSQTLSIISSIKKFSHSGTFIDAESAFLKEYSLKYPEQIAPTPPTIFKCVSIKDLDFEKKEIQLLFESWPVALVGDGCGVNPKAGKIMTEMFGILSPTTRCSGHAASGSIRRMTASKTMCVEEAVTFAKGIKPVLKHFKLSGKSSDLLNSALEIMEMKPLKTMTWCPTRMANILQCSSHTVKILFPLCDMLATSEVKAEEAAYFLSPICIGLIHLFSDLEIIFVAGFLRKLDTDHATIFEVFGLSETLVSAIKGMKTPEFETFLNGLQEDEFGNIKYTKDSHVITLNYTHRPSRTRGQQEEEDKISMIKSELYNVKEKIVNNLIENVDDQNQNNTIVEYASAFDFSRNCSKDTRVSYLKHLHSVYGVEYIHNLPLNAKNDDFAEYEIQITYPPKLQCTENDLVSEFNNMWPVLNKLWLKFKDSKPSLSRIQRFWEHVLTNYSVEYPNMSRLLMILMSISPGTGPLERSFSKLSKICYKDRGNLGAKTLETLYLLSTLAINKDKDNKDKDNNLWNEVRKELQQKGYKGIK